MAMSEFVWDCANLHPWKLREIAQIYACKNCVKLRKIAPLKIAEIAENCGFKIV
jgi:hypothetical protein